MLRELGTAEGPWDAQSPARANGEKPWTNRCEMVFTGKLAFLALGGGIFYCKTPFMPHSGPSHCELGTFLLLFQFPVEINVLLVVPPQP